MWHKLITKAMVHRGENGMREFMHIPQDGYCMGQHRCMLLIIIYRVESTYYNRTQRRSLGTQYLSLTVDIAKHDTHGLTRV